MMVDSLMAISLHRNCQRTEKSDSERTFAAVPSQPRRSTGHSDGQFHPVRQRDPDAVCPVQPPAL